MTESLSVEHESGSSGLWAEDYTGNVWALTDSLLPRLLDSLKDT